MAAPGRILVPTQNERQKIVDVPNAFRRWYRIENHGPALMGVTYTTAANETGRSTTIAAGTSMDFLSSNVVILNDGTSGAVRGTYEALDGAASAGAASASTSSRKKARTRKKATA